MTMARVLPAKVMHAGHSHPVPGGVSEYHILREGVVVVVIGVCE